MIDNALKIWLDSPLLSESEKNKLQKTKKDKVDAYFQDNLQFSLSGVFQKKGLGTNRINNITMALLAKGYSNYLKNLYKKELSILVTHDGRKDSREFANIFAKVLQSSGVNVFIFNKNNPAPISLVSFVTKRLDLDGSVIITASYLNHLYSGLKILNSEGFLINKEEQRILEQEVKVVDPSNIDTSSDKFTELNENVEMQYLNLIKENATIENPRIKVAISNLKGSTFDLARKSLANLSIDYYFTQNEICDEKDGRIKSANPEDFKSYRNTFLLAKKKKADLGVVISPDGSRMGVFSKFKRRFKYLNGNEIAAIILDYKLMMMKRADELKPNSYIITSVTSSDLCKKVAHSYGVKVYQTNLGFANISKIIKEKEQEHFILATESTYGFLLNKDICYVKDSLQTLTKVCEVANYLKSQSRTLYEQLLILHKKFGFYREHIINRELPEEKANNLFDRICKSKKLGQFNIRSVIDYRSGPVGFTNQEDQIKVIFDTGDWVVLRRHSSNNSVKMFFCFYDTYKIETAIIQIRRLERQIEYITEENLEKKVTWRSALKYIIFALVLFATFYIVFKYVYVENGGVEIISAIWSQIKHAMNSSAAIWFILLIGSMFLTHFLNGLFTVRAMKAFGYKVKFRHAAVASFISTFLSAITPFATGGQIVSYWYMRRKGYKKSELASTYSMSTLLYQTQVAIKSIVFFPLAFFYFGDVILADNPQSRALLTFLLIGIGFDIFASIMIGLLVFSKRMHQWIVYTAAKLLEYMGFIKDYDYITARYMHEMNELRDGAKFLWSKKAVMAELFFYELVPAFVASHYFAVMTIAGGDFSGVDYWKFLTGNKLVLAANAMMPTPGASGTTEWITNVLYQQIFGGVKGITDPVKLTEQFTALNRLITYILPVLLSGGLLLLIYLNERSKDKINSINKNRKLADDEVKLIKYRFKRNVVLITTPIIVSIMLALILSIYVF